MGGGGGDKPCVVFLAVDISFPREAGVCGVCIQHLFTFTTLQAMHMPLTLGHLQIEPVADDAIAGHAFRDVTRVCLGRKFVGELRAGFLGAR